MEGMIMEQLCYCGSGLKYKVCCEKYILGQVLPETPEKLMRSRYSAFATQNIDYITATLDPQAMDQYDRNSNKEWAEKSLFIELQIISSSENGPKGAVEFIAKYEYEKEIFVHHEKSKFRKKNGQWYFREGKIIKAEKIQN